MAGLAIWRNIRRSFAILVCSLLVACGDDGGTASLEVTADAGTPVESVELAPTVVGGEATAVLHVTNGGDATTGRIALGISGAAANDFVFDNALTTCAGRALEPAATCDIVIAFRPTVSGHLDPDLRALARYRVRRRGPSPAILVPCTQE
jgi:hypothetical protein